MKSLFSLPLFLLALNAHADTLTNYLAFARQDINARSSDFQGTTGAGGAIQLTDFFINGNLLSAASVRLTRGSVARDIVAPKLRIENAGYRRASHSAGLNAHNLSLELENLSLKLSALAVTNQARPASAIVKGQELKGLLFSAEKSREVIEIDAETLSRSGNIFLGATPNARLVIRIRGLKASLVNTGVFLMDQTRPSQIVFHFPDATDLTIAHSGGPLGVPGSIVAPCATFRFAAALVTGEVYVARLLGGLPTGQVNLSHSSLLRELQGETCKHHCDDSGDNGK